MSEKESLELKIRTVMRVTTAFVIMMVVSIAAELIIVAIGSEALLAKNLMKLFGALALISPFGIMIPLFFRVNYQSRLLVLQQKEKAEREKEKNPKEQSKQQSKAEKKNGFHEFHSSLGKESD